MNSREFVFKTLLKLFKSEAYSNILLNNELNKQNFTDADKSFITACFYGVIEKKITLDYELSIYLKQPLKKLRPEVLCVLRLGAYQILFMDRIPDSAAINESVKLVKKNKCAFASGLVNAVLRKVSSNGLLLPEKSDENFLSVKYSVPDLIINLWIEDYGLENALGILDSLSHKPKTVVRVNTLLCDASSLADKLSEEGVKVSVNELISDSLIIEKSGALSELECFKQGLFHVEDTAAQIAALSLQAKEGERVLDCCAAPGGKSFTVAEQMKNGTIISCDLYENRVNLIKKGAKRLKIDFIKAVVSDASVFNKELGEFDKILCDVPCSGLGIIRRKPEIRYKTQEDIKNSSQLQSKILNNSFKYLKQGGKLIYSTCTLNKKENEEVVSGFVKAHSDAKLNFQKTFFPHIDKTDGFFIAEIIKK